MQFDLLIIDIMRLCETLSRKLASASWSLLALASIPGAAQGHHVIFHAKGGDPPKQKKMLKTLVQRSFINSNYSSITTQ